MILIIYLRRVRNYNLRNMLQSRNEEFKIAPTISTTGLSPMHTNEVESDRLRYRSELE